MARTRMQAGVGEGGAYARITIKSQESALTHPFPKAQSTWHCPRAHLAPFPLAVFSPLRGRSIGAPTGRRGPPETAPSSRQPSPGWKPSSRSLSSFVEGPTIPVELRGTRLKKKGFPFLISREKVAGVVAGLGVVVVARSRIPTKKGIFLGRSSNE